MYTLGICSQCNQDAARFHPAGPIFVEWSTDDPGLVLSKEDRKALDREGCVGEFFCSWICAARWFRVRAGVEAPADQW